MDSFIKKRKRDSKRQNTKRKILDENEKDKQNHKKSTVWDTWIQLQERQKIALYLRAGSQINFWKKENLVLGFYKFQKVMAYIFVPLWIFDTREFFVGPFPSISVSRKLPILPCTCFLGLETTLLNQNLGKGFSCSGRQKLCSLCIC